MTDETDITIYSDSDGKRLATAEGLLVHHKDELLDILIEADGEKPKRISGKVESLFTRIRLYKRHDGGTLLVRSLSRTYILTNTS